ncbi:MAG: undecaprenyl-diphosphate phosphatase [Kiloniellales bacterium]|nr:undecaprenyl-diphosphate phosphatase [Kiloniellales bacterium]
MPFLHLAILALIQGITEFLPISSSGHLVLTWHVFDAVGMDQVEQSERQRLVLDVAVHLGTLLAVLLYFRRDIIEMAAGLLKLLVGKPDRGTRLALYVVLGSIPLVIVGLLAKDLVIESLRNPTVVASATLGFGLLLFIGDQMGLTIRRVEHLNLGMVAFIGCAQVLALIPGTSRAGITMTAARFCGFERGEAARFSLLLAVPAILGASTLAGRDLYQSGSLELGLNAAVAAGLAFLSALLAIAAMMKWLRRASFTPFVVYRVALAAVLFYLIYEAPLRA